MQIEFLNLVCICDNFLEIRFLRCFFVMFVRSWFWWVGTFKWLIECTRQPVCFYKFSIAGNRFIQRIKPNHTSILAQSSTTDWNPFRHRRTLHNHCIDCTDNGNNWKHPYYDSLRIQEVQVCFQHGWKRVYGQFSHSWHVRVHGRRSTLYCW